ncbi:MAG: HlyD family efflux transporter periplasmic adaptor subunit [Chlamydiae bacterium]|nr:HlyD family efflux transporter periplasmic adaptor subunit [Chlamydiota bacterium]
MIIFRTAAIYLAIAGIILIAILVKMMGAPTPTAPHVKEPSVNPYERTISASGIVEATDKNIFIGVPEDGLVEKMFVTVWDKVKKGQPLYQLDTRLLQAQLISERASVKVAEATLHRLEDQLSRLKSILDPRAVSIEELKTKECDVMVAKAQLDVALANVSQTQTMIQRLIVKAPKEGVILQNNIREGEHVSRITTTMILGDLEHLQVRADIDEQNAGFFSKDGKAVAYPKNNTLIAIPLKFVRVEPYVLPKISLTGATGERVDTRVLQVVYSFDQPENYHIYVGQQVDLFIERVEKK